MLLLKEKDIVFSDTSIVDEAGKVFFYCGRVFRAIYSKEFAELYIDLLDKEWIKEIFDAGLVKTWICEDLELEGAHLILEHRKIPFETHPAECTSKMHWLAAKAMIGINLKLSKYGYILKDSHPWNLMYHKGNPYYIDFGSMIKADKVSDAWGSEFRKYFGIPIWLASTKWKKFALEYRRQHLTGFGLEFFELIILKKLLFRTLDNILRYTNKPLIFFSLVDKWLDKHRPLNSYKEYWAGYMQSHGVDPLSPRLVKQKFVYDILKLERPKKVLDCAVNKGFYAEMAARLGASVIAFDYEELCVDTCLCLADKKRLDITPVIMDFKLPTPNYGIGLCGGSAIERFQSDIVLALGIAHHLCINQSLPVKTFCDVCLNYAKKGIVFEYVDPSDKHVESWNMPIPNNYALEEFIKYLSYKFPKVEQSVKIIEGGICRTMVYLHC